jgi:hypothetical protein
MAKGDTGRRFSLTAVKPFGSLQCAGPARRRLNFMEVKEFEKKFEAGKNILREKIKLRD